MQNESSIRGWAKNSTHFGVEIDEAISNDELNLILVAFKRASHDRKERRMLVCKFKPKYDPWWEPYNIE